MGMPTTPMKRGEEGGGKGEGGRGEQERGVRKRRDGRGGEAAGED